MINKFVITIFNQMRKKISNCKCFVNGDYVVVLLTGFLNFAPKSNNTNQDPLDLRCFSINC